MAKVRGSRFLPAKIWKRKATNMKKLSGIVIARDAENVIADCLESISFCQEIIVVDNDSKDRTSEIARRAGAKVFSTKTDDFSQMRNLGLKKSKEEWILYIDADERIDKQLENSITSLLRSRNERKQIAAYVMKRKNFYYGNFEWPYIERLARLFRKSSFKGWRGKLHETAFFEGESSQLDGFLIHFSHTDLTSMLNKTIDWSTIEAQLRFDSGHPSVKWWRFPRVMITAFVDSYIKQKGFKAGTAGLIEAIYQSFSMFITYAKLWEMQNRFSEKNHSPD